MRIATKVVGWAIAFTVFLHYYCSVNECSNDLLNFCHYTSPKTWHEQLLEQSDIYNNNISPAMISVHREYTKTVRPSLLRLESDLERKVYTPLMVYTKHKYENFDSQRYLDWVYEKISVLNRKIRFYFNVFVKPRLIKLICKCKVDEYCYKIHNRIGPFLEKARLLIHYLRPYTTKAKESLEEGYEGLKNFYYQSSHWMGNGVFSVSHTDEPEILSTSESDFEIDAEAGSDSETETETEADLDSDEDHQNEDFEYETETLTSTIIVTMTMDDQNGVVTSKKPELNDVELSEQDILQEEIKAWYNMINKQSRNLIKIFNADVDSFVDRKIEAVEPSLKEKTQSLSKKSQNKFQEITKAIQDINCTTSVDPKTGEILYFDRTGITQLSEYVSRPLMRALFNETKTELEGLTSEVKNDLAQLVEEIEKKVKVIRDDVLEVYEEWADVMISEWSKRLAYIDVVAGHLDDSDEGSTISSGNWKKFLKLKKQVISKRDELAIEPAALNNLKTFINKVEYILSIITKESGEYTYILRSRANLAFQERERQEREKFRLEQEAQEAQEAQESAERETEQADNDALDSGENTESLQQPQTPDQNT